MEEIHHILHVLTLKVKYSSQMAALTMTNFAESLMETLVPWYEYESMIFMTCILFLMKHQMSYNKSEWYILIFD